MEKRMEDPCTLSRFILEEFRGGDQDMSFIMNAISVAAKVIANAVQHAGIRPLSELHGMFRSSKSEGRNYSQLDELAGDVLLNALRYSQQVGLIFLDGHENPVSVPSENGAAPKKYAVVADPLDGSMNISSNISVGTTFGVYKSSGGPASLADILQAGNMMRVAGYILYGSATVMMFTSGKGVHMFVMDPDYGEFVMTKRDVKIPNPAAQIYSINSGNSEVWDRATREFVRWTKSQAAPYSARYVGSMVSDVHRTLLCGGIFMYPCDKKTVTGKLRLLCECFPLSMLVEQAGGLSTTGNQRILDIIPRDIHEKASIFLGCTRDVQQVQQFYTFFGTAYEEGSYTQQQAQQLPQHQQQQQQQQQQQPPPQQQQPPPPQHQQHQQQQADPQQQTQHEQIQQQQIQHQQQQQQQQQQHQQHLLQQPQQSASLSGLEESDDNNKRRKY